eukprot:6195430-Pleurochrysis_carterae.AAC.1
MVAPTKEQVYVVGRELGFGQTAIVYEGRKRVNGDICALKCFKSDELRNTPYAVDALRAEVEILRALPPHKNVVTLHDVRTRLRECVCVITATRCLLRSL